MSAQEIIDQIKCLPPKQRAEVTKFVVEGTSSDSQTRPMHVVVVNGPDGLPVIRGSEGLITSQLVHEIESLTP